MVPYHRKEERVELIIEKKQDAHHVEFDDEWCDVVVVWENRRRPPKIDKKENGEEDDSLCSLRWDDCLEEGVYRQEITMKVCIKNDGYRVIMTRGNGVSII